MWRCCVCAMAMSACTDSSVLPAFVEFQARASIRDAKLDLTVNAYDLFPAPDGNGLYLTDANVNVRFRGQTVELAFDPYLFVPGNHAVLDLANDVETDEAITFTLAYGDTSAEVTDTCAPDFAIAPPVAAKPGAPGDLAWTPASADVMTWSGMGCAGDFDGPVPVDTGMLEFPPVVFGVEHDGCSVELTMTRSRTTPPPSPFDSVSVATERRHTIDFTVTP